MKPVHITAGLLAIAAGALALSVAKGGTMHRRSGTVFVYAMLVMALVGALLAFMKGERLNIGAGLMTAYFALTAFLTVRRPAQRFAWVDTVAVAAALILFVYVMRVGFDALQMPRSRIDGVPAGVAFFFGGVLLLAAIGDLRMLARGVNGAARLGRHLWRMCFAMFIATASFFLGQAQVFPPALRITPVLAVPVLLVLIVMLYWVVRVLLVKRLPRVPAYGASERSA